LGKWNAFEENLNVPVGPSNGSHQTLKNLSEAVGVSGGESEVRQLILSLIKDRVAHITVDPMGNLIACRKGTGESSLRVLVSAPMHKIGLMVSEVGEDGLIHVMAIGSLDARVLPARRVLVGRNKSPGVLLWTPIHRNRSITPISPDDMLVDVGAYNKGDAKAKPGARIAFVGDFLELTPTVVRGKAFESRAACAVLVAILETDPFPFDLYVTFTAQSAIGGRGAGVAAHRIAPHAAFALTGINANDFPHLPDEDRMPTVRLGGGPVLSAMDFRAVGDRRLTAHLHSAAEAENIPLQVEALRNQPSQGAAISLSRSGVPTVSVGVPIRYLGSPNELVNLDDLSRLVQLLRASLSTLTPAILEF